VILTAHDRYLPIPSEGLAQLAVMSEPRTLIRSTSMMRLSEGKFDMLTAGRRDERGQPTYWTVRGDKGEVWPVPDKDYNVQARDVLGRDPDQRARPVATVPVLEYIAAAHKAQEEAERMASEAREKALPRAEYFGRRPVGLEEGE
jgi:hypothetical protein